jgi:hypothetical protein
MFSSDAREDGRRQSAWPDSETLRRKERRFQARGNITFRRIIRKFHGAASGKATTAGLGAAHAGLALVKYDCQSASLRVFMSS